MSPSVSSIVDPIRAVEAFRNLDVPTLIEHCLERDGCRRAADGAVVAYSGAYTGRTPKDKRTVREPSSEDRIWWDGNHAIAPEAYAAVRERVLDHLGDKAVYVVDAYAGADPAHRIAVRFVVERPYHALFVHQLLLRPTPEELAAFAPDWTVIDAGRLKMVPGRDPVPGDAAILLDFAHREVLIAGTEYAGEMKKSVFTIMNDLLPGEGILSMHCSANVGEGGDVALFFGLSGTGKTTLSADPARRLIGDDEHGWGDAGVFNVEGGCYAKCIDLSPVGEPEIYAAIREGAVLENVVLDDAGNPDYADASITENTRAAYPIESIPNAVLPSVGGHPTNVVFLTADAMGVLPPIARLTPEQALVYFLNGYTAKVAGTEAGVREPQAVFSTCFGQPFLPRPPKTYADLLKARIERHDAKVWLVNTGWTGGPYGVGHRMRLADTRAMLAAALSGELDLVPYEIDPVFGLHVPTSCPDVPHELLTPRATWTDPDAYDARARELRAMFDANAAKFTEGVPLTVGGEG